MMTSEQTQSKLPLSDPSANADGEKSYTITLEDRIVPYVLRKSRRRSIGLQIDHRGLRVMAPLRASLNEVESVIRKHTEWVVIKLDEWRNLRRPEKITLKDGMMLPYLGEMITIRFAVGKAPEIWNPHAGQMLTLFARSPEKMGVILEEALRGKALQYFSARLNHFAHIMQIKPPKLSLSAAKTRWGSCSKLSGIRLNWRLIHFAPALVDYVIIHELAHLFEMNHSARFWQVVERICPDYRARREALKKQTNLCPTW